MLQRVIIVGKFFPPSHEAMALYMGDVADAVAARGIEVVAVAAREPAPYMGPARIRGVPSPFRRARRLWVRGLDALIFSAVAAWHTWRAARRGTAVLCLSMPPFAAFAVYPVARLRGAAFVWLEYDIYPEIVSAVARLPRPFETIWRRARDLVRRRVQAIIVPAPGMAAHVRRSTPDAARVEVIPNWADENIHPRPRSENPIARELGIAAADLVVLYSGTIGHAHVEPLLALVAAAARLPDRSVRWVFIGWGGGRPRLERAIRERGLSNVTLLDRQPTDRVPFTLTLANLAVVAVDHHAIDLLYPSKIYGYLAAGIPILILCEQESDLDREIVDTAAGWRVSPDDPVALAALLQRLHDHPEELAAAGVAARRHYEAIPGRERGTTRYVEVLTAAVTKPD